MLGIRVAMASTYYPQTNGLIERLNRTLISLIRKYAHAYPKHWAEFLPMFEFAYNNTVHLVTQVAPFIADKGYYPPMPVSLLNTRWNIASPHPTQVKDHLAKLRRMMYDIWQMIRRNEEKKQQQVTERENKHRGNHKYEPGDEVLVYWPPFRAYAELERKHRLRYIGPFTVIKYDWRKCRRTEGASRENAKGY